MASWEDNQAIDKKKNLLYRLALLLMFPTISSTGGPVSCTSNKNRNAFLSQKYSHLSYEQQPCAPANTNSTNTVGFSHGFYKVYTIAWTGVSPANHS